MATRARPCRAPPYRKGRPAREQAGDRKGQKTRAGEASINPEFRIVGSVGRRPGHSPRGCPLILHFLAGWAGAGAIHTYHPVFTRPGSAKSFPARGLLAAGGRGGWGAGGMIGIARYLFASDHRRFKIRIAQAFRWRTICRVPLFWTTHLGPGVLVQNRPEGARKSSMPTRPIGEMDGPPGRARPTCKPGRET